MLAVKSKKKRLKISFFYCKKMKLPPNISFSHISSSYAKILGETNFCTWEIPRSGSKAKDGEREKRKKERLNDGNNNGQLRIANATSVVHAKPPGQIFYSYRKNLPLCLPSNKNRPSPKQEGYHLSGRLRSHLCLL